MKVLYPIRSRRWIPARAVAGRFVRAGCRFGRFIPRGALRVLDPRASSVPRRSRISCPSAHGVPGLRGEPRGVRYPQVPLPGGGLRLRRSQGMLPSPGWQVQPHRPRWKSMTGFTPIPWGGHSWKRGPPLRHGANLQPGRQRYRMEKHYVRGLRAPAARPCDGGALGHLRIECPCGPAGGRAERSAGCRPGGGRQKMALRKQLANEFTIIFFRGALAVEICYPSAGRWENGG